MEISKDIFSDGHKIEVHDMMLATRISSALDKHYPGHLWAVNVNSEQGVVDIKNFNVSLLYGFRLMLAKVQNDPTNKMAIMAGGEILERAAMNRGTHRVGENATHIDGVRDKHQPRADGKILI